MATFFGNAINRGKGVAQKTQLKAEILLLERTIRSRKKVFGVELYNDLNEITCQQDFYATTDQTIATLRPSLLSTDREIRALSNKKLIIKGELDLIQARRAEAFPAPAANWKEKAANAAQGTGMAANEAKIRTEMKVVETQMYGLKEEFGLTVFPVLEQLFGTSSGPIGIHSSTDEVVNKIRSTYQTCKADIIVINRKILSKQALIEQVDVNVSIRNLS